MMLLWAHVLMIGGFWWFRRSRNRRRRELAQLTEYLRATKRRG